MSHAAQTYPDMKTTLYTRMKDRSRRWLWRFVGRLFLALSDEHKIYVKTDPSHPGSLFLAVDTMNGEQITNGVAELEDARSGVQESSRASVNLLLSVLLHRGSCAVSRPKS